MPNPHLLSIMVLMLAMYPSVMWGTKIVNERGDEILFGVAKGVPISTKDRWTILISNWFPWVAVLIGFIAIMGLGILEIARGAEVPKVRVFGYMCVTLFAGADLFWLVLGYSLFRNMASTLRGTTRT